MGDTGSLELKPDGVLVYRVFGWTGRLLYIGITGDLCQRFNGHRQESLWWPDAQRVEWEEFPDRRSAAAEELRLIRRHRPEGNTMGVKGWSVVLTEQPDWHRPGCPVGAAKVQRRISLGDRV